MGFSVTAASVIFAVAMLTATSAALGEYWKTQDHLQESRRLQDDRLLKASHTSLVFVGTPSYNAGANRYDFTVRNDGSVGLDYTKFEYIIDGTARFTQSVGYPKVNGVSTSSTLLLPGDTLDVRLTSITSSPSKAQVVTEFGISVHYP